MSPEQIVALLKTEIQSAGEELCYSMQGIRDLTQAMIMAKSPTLAEARALLKDPDKILLAYRASQPPINLRSTSKLPTGFQAEAKDALPENLPSAELRQRLYRIANETLSDFVVQQAAVKLEQTSVGLVAVIPSRRDGLLIYRSADPGFRAIAKDNQNISAAAILDDGTVLAYDVFSHDLFVDKPHSNGVSTSKQYARLREPFDCEDSLPTDISIDPKVKITVQEDDAILVELSMPELAGRTVIAETVGIEMEV